MPGETAPKEFEFRPLSVFPANQPATEFRFEVSRDGGWHEYRMLRAEEWATHSLRHEDRKSGIRSVITKTETRGPYTRPFTVYFIHTKTAFSVKGVCKRFSDFKELDVKLKKLFKGFNSPFPPDKVFNALQPEFVNERRKQLQRYLDDALEFPDIANCPDLHVFLNIPEYNDLVSEEQKEEFQRAQIRNSNPDADKPETYLRAIDLAKASSDRIAEAQAFNALGLIYSEMELDPQGIECMESALELCRAEEDEPGICLTLSNLGVAHVKQECHSLALACFQEVHERLERDAKAQAGVKIKMALTYEANGECYEAVEHCLRCLEQCKAADDQVQQASCLFTLGSIYYDAGEVRQAVEAFERCLVLRRKTRNKIGLAEALNKLGLTYCDIGYDLRAIDYFEQSLVICEDNADMLGQAVCLQHLGNVFKMQKDNNLAVDFFERCLAVRTKTNDRKGCAECHDSLGLVLYGMGNFKAATEHYEQSLAIRSALGDKIAESECYKSLGTAYIRMDDSNQAVASFEKCLALQRELESDNGVVDALISLGLAYFKAGDNQTSVQHLEEALRMFGQLPPEDAAASSGKAVCLDHLGNVYSKMGRAVKAVEFYQKSLVVKRDINDVNGEARCRVRIGLEHLSLGDLNEAYSEFKDALKLFESLEDDNGIAICYENLGDTFMKMGDIREAVHAYERCLPIKVETFDKVGEAQCLDNLGLAHYSLNELAKAAEYYEQSLAIWKAEDEKHALMTCCESLGGVCFHLDEHIRSIECYVQYLTLSQEVGDGASDHEILLRLGLSNAFIGEYSVALEFLRQAMAFYIELGDMKNRTTCLQHIGRVLGKMGEIQEGMTALEQALKLRLDSGDKQGIAECHMELGLLLYHDGANAEARLQFDKAQKLLTDISNKAALATCTMHIGATFAAEKDDARAIEHLKTALTVGEVVADGWVEKAECLKMLGQSQTALSDPAALHTFDLALGLWREKGNRAGEASILMQLAESHVKLKRYDVALDQVEESLALRRVVGDWRGQGECLYQLGSIYRLLNDGRGARDAFEQCIEVRREGNDRYALADAMSALGQLLATLGRPDEGLHTHQEALEVRRDLGDTVGIAESLNNLAVCFSQTGDQDRALTHFNECLAIMRKGKDPVRECKCLLNMGACYADSGDFAHAIEIFEQAFEVCRSCGDLEDEAASYCNIGSACVQLRQLERAFESYDLGLRILRQLGDKRGEAECLHNMGAAHFNDGNTELAVKLFDEAFQINRSLKDHRAASACLNSLKAAHIRLGDALQASHCVQLMQEYFPDSEVQSVAAQLEAELEDAEERGDTAEQAALHMKLGDSYEKQDYLALEHYDAALRMHTACGDDDGVVECLKRIGIIKMGQADFDAALAALERAAGFFDGDEWRDGTTERLVYFATILYSMGVCHLALSNNEKAAECLSQSIALREEAEEPEGIDECHNQLGIAYSRLGDTRKAMASLSRGAGGTYLAEDDTPGKVVGVTSLASTLMTLKRYEDAQKTIAKHEANLNVYKTRDDKKSEANCYLVLGQAYLETQQLRLAVESFDLSCRLREELGDEEGMASALKRKGCALFSTGDMKSAVEVLEEYLSIVSRQADRRVFLSKNFKDSRREEVDACCILGRACQAMADMNSASEALKRALALSHESADRTGEAKCLIAFGELYRDIWATRRACEHVERALSICIELQDKAGEAKCVTLLGMMHYARGDTPACTKCLEESLALCKQSVLSSSEAECLMNIGDVHRKQGNVAQAQAHYERADRLCREQMDPYRQSRALTGMAQGLIKIGQAYKAVDKLIEAMELCKAVGDRKGESRCLRVLALAYVAVGKVHTARKVSEQAQQLALENGAVLEAARADRLFALVNASVGRRDMAIMHLQKARDVFAQTAVLGSNKVFLDPHQLGVCLSDLGEVLMHEGQADRAKDHLAQGEQVLLAAEDGHALAALRCRMGRLLAVVPEGSSKIQARVAEEAFGKITQALEAAEAHGNKHSIASCILAEGVVWSRRGDQHKGLAKMRLALDMAREVGNKQQQAECLQLMGEACAHSPQGLGFLEQALAVLHEAADLIGESKCMQALGELQAYLGNTHASAKCWLDALQLNKELGNDAGLKTCLQKLCTAYSRLDDFSRVSDYAGQLREVAQLGCDVDTEVESLLLTGHCHLNLGSPAGAEHSLKAALKLCQDHAQSEQLLVREAACHDKLAVLYTQQERHADAKREQVAHADHVNRLRKKLGKDMLRGVVGPPPKGYSKIFGLGSRDAEVGKGV